MLLAVTALLVLAAGFAWWNVRPRDGSTPAPEPVEQTVGSPAGGVQAATTAPALAPAATAALPPKQTWLQRARRNAWIDRGSDELPAQVRADLREGRFRAALETLRARTSQNDDAAYSLLTQLVWPCLKSNGNFDPAAQRQRMLEMSGRFGADPAARARLPELLDLQQQLTTELRQQLCPDDAAAAEWDAFLAAENARRSAAYTADFGAVRKLPQAQRTDAARAIEDRLAADNPQRRAELAARRLQDSDVAIRRVSLTTLQELSSTSSTARLAIARCMLDECVPGAGNREQGVQALVAAAKTGNTVALHELGAPVRSSDSPLSVQLRGVPVIERYGWWKVREQLIAEGCLGIDLAIRQAVQPAGVIDLMRLNPAEAREAQLRADQLLSETLPAVRTALRCE